jgi:redox-sensitive bicupin YhaK (pirin superfamily)
MINFRKAADRFHTRIGWLDSRHTFSFADHYHPEHMGFSALRVINDDVIAPGQGFGSHPHRDMEIFTYVLEGALQHKDSLGTGSVIRPGDVQRMSAGTGVVHSEFNASREEPVHLLQIWIVPEKRGIDPSYEQKSFPLQERKGRLRLLASRDGREGTVTLHQDAAVYGGVLDKGEPVSFELKPSRQAWVHLARGSLSLNGQALGPGDGAAVSGERKLELVGQGGPAEVLVFDLP